MTLDEAIKHAEEVAQALNEFADNLERIENKYDEENYEIVDLGNGLYEKKKKTEKRGGRMNEEIEIIRFAIRKNGKAMQTIVAIEEMSELQKELTKYIRGQGNRDNLIEEIADVLIMITQIQLMYQICDEDVRKVMDFKLNRLKERIENAE